MTTYRYLTADQWGMTWVREPVYETLRDPEVYVHHTAGGQMSTDAAEAFRALNAFAQNVKGYSALDYDVLVHYDPGSDICTIGEGRGPWRSAATLDRNEEGEAVCVLGYFHPGHSLSRHPYPAEIEGTALAIVWGIENGWIARDAAILGHRDNPAHPGATGCPGDYLYAELDTIRARVAELLNPEEVDVPRYFVTRQGTPTNPSPVWVTHDGANARWVPPEEWSALDSPTFDVVDRQAAAAFTYYTPTDSRLAAAL